MTAAPTSAQLPRPGDMIAGKYVLDRLLGQGGMGAVFAARHLKLSKAVAIKIMLADTSNPEAATRFINEGRAAANIQNEHVVRVDDVDEEMGYAYMVLELLEGEDLSQVLEREPTHRIVPHVAVSHVLQALRGVMAAHAIGIVHRDLKPSNLFLSRRKDGSIVVKVLDFGISKAQGSSALAASPNALTSTKAMLGSPLYMSPEQLRSSKSVDHRADIWAIGVILYELISGHLPFMGENLGELFANILETDPIPLRQRVDGVHPGLDDVVLRCLARKPEQRFQTASELAAALTPYATPQPGFSGTANLMPSGSVPATQLSPALQQGHGTRPAVPPSGSVTSGSGPRAIAQGTAPLGAVTPPQGGLQQTGSGGWQTPAGVPKSRVGLVIAVIVTFLLVTVGAIGAVLIYKSKQAEKERDKTIASAPDLSAPPIPSAPSAALTVPSASASTASSVASSTPSAAPSATQGVAATTTTTTTTSTATTKPTPHHPTGPTAKVEPKPPPPDPTPKKPPTPPPTNTSTSGGLQNAR